ncbi:aminotransferase class IV [Algoriphagus halophytocola]|uniref:branched-chain-amino-acid transaminase n=1 Tax=Algoriphagus halophytocola TaxID=2991499 RepID=A0ABY6MJ60_9BACT|nr:MULTISPECIES: aminotransferase class IV [unclassified Algoriphagus]UZD23828.1 aminotransferase class IV [Algoriphagus sp. TR-M5]WBL41195.1 aminotransferase class IV [Algoriphagus sp. TR-M9]
MIENETFLIKQGKSQLWSSPNSDFLFNRAGNFGDGLFETMIAVDGKIRFFDKHLQRLSEGMALLGLDSCCIDPDELSQLIASKSLGQVLRLRWNVFRAGAGKYTPESSTLIQQLIISAHQSGPAVKNKVAIAKTMCLYPTVWSACKTLNAMPYVLANKERRERGLDEIILMDYRGFVSEAGSSNIFWRKEDEFFTPALACSCINGVSRRVIFEAFLKKKIILHEGEFTLDELLLADQVFVTNCTGISYLSELDEKKFEISPIAELEELFQIF